MQLLPNWKLQNWKPNCKFNYLKIVFPWKWVAILSLEPLIIRGATRCMKKGSLFRKQFWTFFFGQWDLKNRSGNIFGSVGPNLTKRPRGMRSNMGSKGGNIKIHVI